MHTPGEDSTTTITTTSGPSVVEALLHRWLVEYNPAYLLSAALVCGGLTLVSREVAEGDSLWALVGIPAIAELYSLALIGGAAFLVRLDRRRPAVMLGLLALVFQGDPMLHVETCSYLGLAGDLAALAWLGLFFTKLFLLARALELRLCRSVVAVAGVGAVGLALLPHLFRIVEPDTRAAVVALWLYCFGSALSWSTRNVQSAVGWDVRGRRSVRGAWALWATMLVGHAAFWAMDYGFTFAPALTAAPLIWTRFAKREWQVWLAVSVSLGLAALVCPEATWVTALMGASCLTLAAARGRLTRIENREVSRPAPPYRSYEPLHATTTTMVAVDLGPEARPRLFVGALFALHLSLWSSDLVASLPQHSLWLDTALVIGLLAMSRGWRRPWLATPLVPFGLHLAVSHEWISAPTSALEWGATSVGTGFALLFASLWASWLLTRRAASAHSKTSDMGGSGSGNVVVSRFTSLST